jgi:hypothetical protein
MIHIFRFLIISLSCILAHNALAVTQIITENVTITLEDLVGGDYIDITKTILVEQDPNDSGFICGIKTGDPLVFYNASTGRNLSFISGSESIDLTVTFPSNCIDGNNNLLISGYLPTDVLNDETFFANFTLAIRYNYLTE